MISYWFAYFVVRDVVYGELDYERTKIGTQLYRGIWRAEGIR